MERWRSTSFSQRANANRLCMVALTFAMLFFTITPAQTTPADPCSPALVPKSVRKLLKRKFPGWRLLSLSDLTAEERGYWLKTNGENKCPGFAVGHIESKTYLSYGMILTSGGPTKPAAQFLIISDRPKSAPEITLREKYFGLVFTMPPGKYKDTERTEEIQLDLEGIRFEEFQKGAILYYWKKNQYDRLILSE